MRYLVDLVRRCVQGDDYRAVDDAINRLGHESLFDEFCDGYEHLKLRVPVKRPGEFVPGWNHNVVDLGRPYGEDPRFVARAILYSHRVALANRLQLYVHARKRSGGSSLPPATLREEFHKALFYGPLEKAGLLFYVDPWAAGPPRDIEDPGLPREALDDYFRTYMAPRNIYIEVEDWSADTGRAFVARLAAEEELMYGLSGVKDLLKWQQSLNDHVDLYIPEDPRYRDSFEWMLRRDGYNVMGSTARQPDCGALSALWSLPTPSAEAYSKLTVRDVLLIREDATFDRWRSTLQKAVRALAVEATTSDVASAVPEFLEVLTSGQQEVLAAVGGMRSFKVGGQALGSFGVSLASAAVATAGATAAFPGENALAATAGGVAGTVASFAPKIAHGVRVAVRGPRTRRALQAHFSLFATDR